MPVTPTGAWVLIADLPDNWSSLAVSGLSDFAQIWLGQQRRLKTSEALTHFHERLRREWAIETGVIENLYSIDRGTTQLLIEKGIDASLIPHGSTNKPAEEVVAIVRDQEEALEGLFDFVANHRDLTTSYIKELHQLLTRNQRTVRAVDQFQHAVDVPLIRGDWKRQPNNPSRPDGTAHHYCPPEHVAAEMDRLVAMHGKHVSTGVPTEVESAWLHHRFTQIHPFQDGNGRVARTLASLVFIKAGWFPLVVSRDSRAEYIEALEQADTGNLAPLVSLFGQLQKRALLKALSLSEDVLRQAEPLTQVIADATERLKERKNRDFERQRQVFVTARNVAEVTHDELRKVAKSLNETVKGVDLRYGAQVERSTEDTDHWFRRQIIAVAKTLEYYADTRTYRSWVRLKIREEQQADLVVSAHSLGVEFVGVIAVSAFIEFKDRGEEGDIATEEPLALCSDVFQFTYREGQEAVLARYRTWLQGVILLGLDQWRRRL